MKLKHKLTLALSIIIAIYFTVIFYAVKEVKEEGLKNIIGELWEGSKSNER